MRTPRTTSASRRLVPFAPAADAGARARHPAHLHLAREPEAPWDAAALREDVPPATLEEARAGRAVLARLLGQERSAAADFLLAPADFDRRRGWERLGHASLFAFLTRELGLSNGAAYLRSSAARLLPRFPAVEAALRDGKLCLSAVGEVARVLTAANEGDVLPRYFACSSREAREVTAALLPRPAPPRREVVTRLAAAPSVPQGLPLLGAAHAGPALPAGGFPSRTGAAEGARAAPEPTAAQGLALRAHEVEPTQPTQAPRAAVEPLTAELRRVHLTVSAGFMEKVAAARTGLSHAAPRATMEQVLEAALDLLLERQAQRKGLGKRARQKAEAAAPCQQAPAPAPARVPAPRRPHVPADVEREVRLRDGDRCQYPLDGGGVCGSSWQVELDHLVPVALGGATTPGNLRCACRRHNLAAAEAIFGPLAMAAARRSKARRRGAGRVS